MALDTHCMVPYEPSWNPPPPMPDPQMSQSLAPRGFRGCTVQKTDVPIGLFWRFQISPTCKPSVS